MTRHEFLCVLQDKLSGLPRDDVEERLSFYSEALDDRMEEGLSEEEAVAAVGCVEEIALQIIADIPLVKIAKERMTPKRQMRVWEIILLVLGSPLWLSLLIAAFAVVLSLYAVLWSVLLSLWTAFAAVITYSVAGIIAGIGIALDGNGLTGIALVGAGFLCAGLSIFLFYGCRAATKGTVLLTKKIMLRMKSGFMKREEA